LGRARKTRRIHLDAEFFQLNAPKEDFANWVREFSGKHTGMLFTDYPDRMLTWQKTHFP